MRARGSARVAAVLVLMLSLAGCAGLPFGRDEAALGASQPFEMQGRVYARSSDRAFSGSIRWRHTGADDELWLGGPLGQTAAHILRDASGATLTTANQQTYRAMNLESSMRDTLGWALPLADLSHYVLGNAPSGASDENVKRNADQQLTSVLHNGWEVELTPGDQQGQGARPVRLRLRKEAVEVRIVIDQLEVDIS